MSRLAAGTGSPTPTTMILSGVVVSAFCSAVVMFLKSVSSSVRVHGALFWMMGSLASPSPGLLPVSLVAVGAGVLFMAVSGHKLNALSMGEEGVHWLYPSRGLHIAMSQRGKEVLQYVHPQEFRWVRSNLERQARPAEDNGAPALR